MKRILSIIALLLAVVLLLCACNVGETETESGTEETKSPSFSNADGIEPVPERDPARYEWWLNEATELAFEIDKESDKMIFYSLQAGYYEYYLYDEGTYRRDGDSVIVSIYDREYTFVYNSAEDTYSIKNSKAEEEDLVYKRQSAQPTLHPSYAFPEFKNLSFASVVDFGDWKKDWLREIATEEATIKIFLEYYNEKQLEAYRQITDRPVKRGDYVEADYIAYLNGSPVAGLGSMNELIPVITYPEKIQYARAHDSEFIDGLIGHSVGERFEVEVNFPENYSLTEIAGKKVIYEVTINTIYDVRLTDEQYQEYKKIKKVDFENYDACVENFSKSIVSSTGISHLSEAFDLYSLVPEEAYMHFFQTELDQAHYTAKWDYEKEYEEYLEYTGQSEDFMRFKSQVLGTDFLLSYYIAKQFNLTWTEEQYETQYDLMLDEYLNAKYSEEDAKKAMEGRTAELEAELTYQISSYHLVELVFGK